MGKDYLKLLAEALKSEIDVFSIKSQKKILGFIHLSRPIGEVEEHNFTTFCINQEDELADLLLQMDEIKSKSLKKWVKIHFLEIVSEQIIFIKKYKRAIIGQFSDDGSKNPYSPFQLLLMHHLDVYKLLGGSDENKQTQIRESEIVKNPYPRIFKKAVHYQLFELLRKDAKVDLDYHFIFRKMLKDGYIYKEIKDVEFRKFLNDNFEVDIEKTRTLDTVSTHNRLVIYKLHCNSLGL